MRSKKEKLHADLSALLPIWRDSSKSPATIKHTLQVIKNAVTYINPGQTPVVAFDQPLHATAKKIQWHQRFEFGTSKLVVMMGSLHVEMAVLIGLKTVVGLLCYQIVKLLHQEISYCYLVMMLGRVSMHIR